MKVFAFFVLASATFGILNAAPLGDNLADEVQKIFDQILSSIPDSVGFKNFVIDIPQNIFENGKIVGEISLSGLKELDTKFTFDDQASVLNFTLNFEDLAAVVDIEIELEGLLNLDHHLSIHVDLKDLKNDGYAAISLDEAKVTDLKLLLTLGESIVDIKGLLNDDQLSEDVSKFLTENVAFVLNTIDPLLEPYFSNLFKDIINVALKSSVRLVQSFWRIFN